MTSLKKIWYLVCKYFLIFIPTPLFYQLITFINFKRLGFKWYRLNLREPQTFNEKLNYLKLYNRNKLAPMVADKVTVREYVKETIGEQYLIPAIGIYRSADEIDFDALPNKFALKTNHGSGWNLICADKSKLNWQEEMKKLNKWLRKNAFYLSREWQYKNIRPQLICEELLEYEIKDFKIFCSNGKPLYIQVDSDRFTNHERSLFTVNWEETNIQIRYPKIHKPISRPAHLDEMLMLAKKLSKPFEFCRIDLYEHHDQIYFGEITLHPGGGMEPFLNKSQDTEMGAMIDISNLQLQKL